MKINYVVYEIGNVTDHLWRRVAAFRYRLEAVEFIQDLEIANLADKAIGGYDPEYRTKIVEMGEM